MPKHTEHKHIAAAPDKAPSQRMRTAILSLYFPASVLLGLHTGNVLAQIEGFQATDGGNSAQTQTGQHSVITSGIKGGRLGSGTVTSMNIHANESLTINQTSSSSHYLLKSTNIKADHIMGTLNSNGKVTLYSGNGLYFGKGARVNVNSLTASGMDIDVNDFLAGKLEFYNKNGKAAGIVVNQGLIEAATGGSVTLIGGAVKNEGVIMAHSGQVSMIAGEKVTMDFDGDGLIQFVIDKEVLQNAESLDSAVENTGTIDALGGTVLLSGKASSDVFSNVVNNSGVIKAGRIDKSGGKVRLVGLGAGNSVLNTGSIDVSSNTEGVAGGEIDITGDNITNSGTLTANSTYAFGGKITLESEDTTLVTEQAVVSATSEQAEGGEIKILGDKVGLFDEAMVDASGAVGGGEILIGGDQQGLNPDVKNATATYIGESTEVKADATENGDGGRVIVFAEDSAKIAGYLSARGGESSGDGGFIETSGKRSFQLLGVPDITAKNGRGGHWLIDPYDIDIVAGSDTSEFESTNPFDPGGAVTGVAELGVDAIEAALTGGATVTVTTEDAGGADNGGDTGNITLKTILNLDDTDNSGGANTLILIADGTIEIEDGTGSITESGGDDVLNLTLNAGVDVVIDGDVNLNGGDFTVTAGGIFDTDDSAVVLAGIGDITATGGGSFISDDATFTGGLTFDAGNNILNVDDGATLTLGDTSSITASDLDIEVNGLDGGTVDSFIDATGETLTIVSDSDGSLDLGTDNGGSLVIKDAELAQITAGTLELKTTGAGVITVDNVSAANTANLDAVTLDSQDDVVFSNNASTFTNDLTINIDSNDDGNHVADFDVGVTVTTGNLNITGTGAGDEVELEGGNNIVATTGSITIATNISEIVLDAAGAVTFTAGGGALNLADISDTANIGTLNLQSFTDITIGDIDFNNGTTNIDIDYDTEADGGNNLNINGSVDISGSFTADGGGGSNSVLLGADAEVISGAGDIELGTAQNISAITLNDDGNNTIEASDGSVNLTAITDEGSIGTFTINADTNITLDSITLNNASDTTLDINLDTGADEAGVETLTVTGALSSGEIDIAGQGTDDVMSFTDTIQATDSTGNGIALSNADTVSFSADITSANGVSISNINTEIDLGADVDITATTGNVDLNNTVTAIDLSGAGTNIITATAGAVELADVGDSAVIDELEINAGTDITLANVIFDQGGTPATTLDINLDTGAGGAETLNVTGAITAGNISVDGQGTDDTMTFTGLVTATNSDLILQNASSVTFDGGITAATDIDLNSVTDVNLASGTTLQTTNGIIELRNGGVGGVNLTGGGLVTLDSNVTSFTSDEGTIQLAFVDDSGAGESISINSGAGATFAGFNLNDGGTLTVDIGTSTSPVIGATGTFLVTGSVTAGVVDIGGVGGNDGLNIESDITATTGSVTIDNITSIVGLQNITAESGITVDVSSGTTNTIAIDGTSYTSNDGNIAITGDVTLDSTGTITFDSDANDDVTDGSITFNNAINDNSSGDSDLVIDADTGDVSMNAIGTTTQIGTLTVDGNNITFDGNVEATAITATATGASDSIVVDSADDSTSITLDANGGSISFASDDINIRADGVDDISVLESTGATVQTVTFKGKADASTIGIGDAATAADLDLSEAELQTVTSNFDELVIGSGTQSGTITVNDAGGLTALNTSLHLNATAGDIAISSAIDLSATAGAAITLTGDSNTTTLSADMTTNNAAITINDTVLVDGAITLDTTAGNTADAAAISITGAIDGANSGGTDTLTLDAARNAVDGTADAAVTLAGDVEGAAGSVSVTGGQDLEGITIDGSQIDVESIQTTAGNIDIEGTNIDLNSTTYQANTSGSISFTGAVDLDAGAVTSSVVTAGGGGDNITFSSTVDDAASDTTLSLNAGAAGNVDLQGNVGSSNAVEALTVVNAAQADLQNVIADNNISITSTNIDLNSSTYTSSNGALSFTGAVDLDQTGGTTTLTSGGGTGDDITITGLVEDSASANTAFTIDAGANGNVDLQGNVGTTNRVAGFTISSADQVDLANVISNANLEITSANNIDLNSTTYTSVGGGVILGGAVDLDAGAVTTTITSASGSVIQLQSTVDDATNDTTLSLNAGTGAITVSDDVGGTSAVGALTANGTNRVNLVDVIAENAIQVSSNDIRLSGNTYTSNNDLLNFSGPVLLNLGSGTASNFTSGGGAGDSITFTSTINANFANNIDQSITMTAGAGNVSVTGAIGATQAMDGGVNISGAQINTSTINTNGTSTGANNNAGDVTITATGGTITVGAITAVGKGTGNGGAVDIDADGANAITVQAIDASGGGTTDTGGNIVINTAGGTGVITVNDDLTSTGATTGGNITLVSATELAAASIAISTGTAGGTISFNDDVNSDAGQTRNLNLTAGSGDVNFGNAGGDTVGNVDALGDIVISSAANLTIQDTVDAASLTQSAGTGTTQTNGLLTLSGSGTNLSITTDTIDMNQGAVTNGGNVVLNSVSGVTLDGGNIVTSGAVNAADTSDNAGTIDIDVTAAGAVAMTGNLDASGAASNASAAGDGALVTINTFDGSITVADINTSGGAGTGQNGGDAAQIQITAGDNGGSNGDNITIGTLSARGGTGTAAGTDSAVTITASAGAVIDGNGATDNIDATSLVIDARDGIGNGDALETVVESFDIDNTNSNNVEIVNAAIASATVTKINNATAGAINFTQTGNQLLTLTSLTAGDGSITISNTGGTTADINIGSITADTTNDVVAIISSGAIEDSATDTATDITARTVTLNAVEGVGATEELETTSAAQTATSTNGNIDIDNSAVTGAATVVTNLQTGTGSINYDQTGNESLTINAASTTDGGITIRNTGDANTDVLTIGGAMTAGGTGNIQLTTITRGDISVDNNLTATSDTITVDSSDDINLGNAIAISTGGAGQVNLNVDVNGDVAATLDLGTGSTITSADINFDGNATGDDTLAAQDVSNTWILTGSGTLDNANLSSTAVWTDFTAIEGGTNTDTVDQTNASAPDNAIAIVLSSEGTQDGMAGNISGTGITTTSFDNIDEIFTDQTGSTITGAPSAAIADATWTIDGGNENYTDDASSQHLDYSGTGIFTTLTGGTGNDTFNITESYTGDIAGGDGTNVYNLSSTTGDVLTGNITGGAGADTFNFGTPTGTPPGISDYTITGNVVGSGGSDTIDFSGSMLVQRVTLSSPSTVDGIIQDEPLSADPPDADLIGGSFSSIENLVGNSQGSLLGPNVATFWNITGSDSGTYGNTLANIGDQTFNNLGVIAGSADDLIVFQNGGELTLGFDGGGGTNTLAGSLGIDTFDITGATGVNITVGGNTTTLLNINNIDGANATDDGTTTVGDSGVDTFNVDNSWTGTLAGAGGFDVFDLAQDVTVGSIQGGAGTDTLDAADDDTANTTSVTGGNADGNDGSFSGNAFTGIDIINTGDGADTYNIQAVGATLVVNAGDGGDTFNVSSDAPTNTGNLNGIGATISLNGDANTAGSDVLNLIDANDATVNNGTITTTTITGLGMTGGVSYTTLEDINITLGSANDNFTVASTNAGTNLTVNGSAGDDTFNLGTGGTMDGILGNVTINGNAHTTADRINLNDASDADGNTYDITANTIDRTGVPQIAYNTIERIDVNTGAGADTINASGWAVATGNVTDAGGVDVFNVTGSFSISGDFAITGIESLADGTPGAGGNNLGANLLDVDGATGGIDLSTTVTTLEVTNSGTGLRIEEVNDIELSDLDLAAGDIILSTTSGSITNNNADSGAATTDDAITTTGSVSLSAGGAGNAIGTTANKVNFDAAPSSITANASNGAGGVFLNQTTGTMTIAGIDAGTGDIELMSSGAIEDTGTINGGTLTATSGGAITLDAGHTIQGFTATADDDIRLDNTGNLSLNAISTTNDEIQINNTSGNVFISGAVDSGGTGATIINTTTSGDIRDNGGSISSVALTLNAAGGIGTTGAITTDTFATINLTSAGAGSAGNIAISETSSPNGLSTSNLNLDTDDASAQTVTISGPAGITINDTAAGVSTLDSNDTLVLDGTIDVINNAINAGNRNLTLQGDTTLSAGNQTFNTGTNNFRILGNLNGGANTVGINAGQAQISGNVTASDLTVNTTGAFNTGGDITLTGDLDVNNGSTTTFAGDILADDILLEGTSSSFTGSTILQSRNNIINLNNVTGSGALQIRTNAVDDVINIATTTTADPNILDIKADEFSGFSGELIIGGFVNNPTPNVLENNTEAGDITVDASLIDIQNNFNVGTGNLTLLADSINIEGSSSINAGDELIMVAQGSDPAANSNDGDITFGGAGGTPNIIDAGNTILVAENTVNNLSGARFVGDTISVSVDADQAENVEDPAAGTTASPADPSAAILAAINNALGFAVAAVDITVPNPASALIGLQEIAFIDVGLFEEELTLFGIIGNGIALSLAQCEEVEGCAPNVTEEELNELIAALEARIDELDLRLADATDAVAIAELEALIAGFEQELNNYRNYLADLKDFLEGGEEEEFAEDFEEDFETDFDTDFSEELPTAPADVATVESYGEMLETVNNRIEWLESLKSNPEERARLSKQTGIDLTLENLEMIIEASRQEAGFIENQIKLLLEGTEALLPKESPQYSHRKVDENLAVNITEQILPINGRIGFTGVYQWQ